MQTCADCGKNMATAGGLEIHMEIAHKAGAVAQPDPEPEVGPPAEREVVPLERPRKTGEKNRAAVPVIALLVVIMLVAGVASALVRKNEKPGTPLAMVQASASTTADAGTAKVAVTAKSSSGPLAKGITVDMGFDFNSRRANMTVDTNKFGLPGVGKIEAVADYASGLIMYMKFPAQFSSELGGKPWVKMDVGALLKQAGLDVDLGALTQGQSADPTSGLELLRGADSVVAVGTEAVRGTQTTHYRLVVNLDKAVAEAPAEQRDALSKFVNIYTVHTFPAEVWLDADGRVLRYQQTIDPSTIHLPAGLSSKNNPFTGPITTIYEFYDFGSPVDVQIPPANQVTDLSDLIRQGR